MKKYLMILMTVMMIGVTACGTTPAEENVVYVDADADAEAAKAEEEAKVAEEAKKAEEEAKAAEEAKKAEEEAKKAEEEAKKAEEEAKAAEEEAKRLEEIAKDGLDAEVDRDAITSYTETVPMFVQSNVNVRKGPGTQYDRVDNYKVNTAVNVIGEFKEEGWYVVEYKDSTKACIHKNFLGKEEVDLEALKAAEEAKAMAAIQKKQAEEAAAAQAAANGQAQTPAAPAPAPQVAMPPAGILFIGDSRGLQMQEAVGGGNSSWVCENSKGYNWFVETAIPRCDPSIGKGTKVVICLGVNDTQNCDKYAEIINAKAAEWAARGAKTYFVSVNPVWENPWVTEERVELFNSSIIGKLAGVRYIDTHSYLAATGYRLVDGLHFDAETYVKIFNAIVGSL